ncbi:MAG: hypothetical protein IKB23_06745 [Clostridia bacterium]|nr:hypothetical protein [Clostridia bacterium]
MKKIVTVFLAMLMVFSLSVSAFAELGGFMESPSANQAPELIKGENESEDCEAQIIITAYGSRDQLSEEARLAIEAAYAMILGAEDLSALNPRIAEIAKSLGVDVKDLAVSDLFDISATDCNGHVDHGHFDITIKPESLENFVCLLHYYNGEWRIVDNAEVTNNGEHLEFDEDEFSPFAIVVATEALKPVQNRDSNNDWIVILICSVAAVAAIGGAIFAIVKFNKKKKA